MNTNLSWKELRTTRWSLAWKLGKPMSGGLKRNFYGWSLGCRFGGVMFTRFATACAVLLLLVGITHAQDPLAQGCPRNAHVYAPWYKQSAIYYIGEQPAHVCKICGSFQNSEGRFMQLVGSKFQPGGLGTLTIEAARAQVTFEVLADFGSWDNYTKAKAKDGYGFVLATGGAR